MASRSTVTAAAVVAAVVAMVGLSYAAVPLYREFCQATGYGGATQVAKAAPKTLGERIINVRFDANVAQGLDWTFKPEVDSIDLKVGKTATVFFHVHNLSDHEVRANAVYNVTPDAMGAYFDKISCFCFNEQVLAPHQEADLPVVFFLDPALEKDDLAQSVDSVTLSYTFYASKTLAKPLALQDTRKQPNL